jgi:phosphatidate phosphatase APP1
MANCRICRSVAAAIVLIACLWTGHRMTAAQVKSDEQIVFLPAIARETADGWEISVRGFVYEPESRPGARLVLRKYLGLDDDTWSDEERRIFLERTKPFLIDAESRRTVRVRIGPVGQELAPTDGSGAFAGIVLIPSDPKPEKPLAVEAVLPSGDKRRFTGPVEFVSKRGLTVVSDIDDTIKITDVRNHHEALLNTFARPFQAVANMAPLYRNWHTREDAAFHYLSAGPWQLYPALDGFLHTNGFPSGSVVMRAIRIRDELFGTDTSEEYKLREFRHLLAQFPLRDFILVGDSGEKDPETYGTIFREHPDQIRRILIRDVTGEASTSPRFAEAFRNVPPDHWQLFSKPAEIVAP